MDPIKVLTEDASMYQALQIVKMNLEMAILRGTELGVGRKHIAHALRHVTEEAFQDVGI